MKKGKCIEVINKLKKDNMDLKVIKGDHLCYRYEMIESVGKGAFGEVIK